MAIKENQSPFINNNILKAIMKRTELPDKIFKTEESRAANIC